ncbi:MAG: hypothetical protein QM790_01600 [Nibricoccus sp.]
MNSLKFSLRLGAVLACLSLPVVSHAGSGIIPSPAGSKTEFHIEAGLTYASGVNNVIDQLKKNYGFEDDGSFPLGLRLSAYAKLENGFGFGAGIGPSQYIRVRTNHPRGYYYYDGYYYDGYYYHGGYYYYDDYETSYIVPIYADVRYYFPKNDILSPYVRAGIAYPISGGDHLNAGRPGAIGAVGANFLETRYVSVGVELGFDDSRVEVKSGPFHPKEKVRPTEWTISVFATF